MSPQQPRNQGAKVEGRDDMTVVGGRPHERFAVLAKRLVQVPTAEIMEEDRRWRADRDDACNEVGDSKSSK